MTQEAEFLERLDARFPYADDAQAHALIAQGRALSANAAFAVLEEIARAPRSVDVDPSRQRDLAAAWADGFDHVLKPQALECAEALIAHRPLPVARVAELIQVLAAHPGQWAALNLADFAADHDEPKGAAQVDALGQALRESWRAEAA